MILRWRCDKFSYYANRWSTSQITALKITLKKSQKNANRLTTFENCQRVRSRRERLSAKLCRQFRSFIIRPSSSATLTLLNRTFVTLSLLISNYVERESLKSSVVLTKKKDFRSRFGRPISVDLFPPTSDQNIIFYLTFPPIFFQHSTFGQRRKKNVVGPRCCL